ncbi:hypothetical protein ACX0HA_08435 [Flavobacterium hauense]
MEPNKIEKDFKEKLEQRTIQPSGMAWDRLDAMLSVAENKKPKKSRAWMYMAAAFLVFLLAGVLFLNQEKENNGLENNNSVVTTEQQQPQTEVENNKIEIAPIMNQEAVAINQNPSDKNRGTHNKINKQQVVDATDEGVLINAPSPKPETQLIITNDAQKLLATATPTETVKKRTGVKVDPNALLSAAEEELDDSFKDKVLIGAVKNFNVVRSAVANRNYE